jgi:hypothetical protein
VSNKILRNYVSDVDQFLQTFDKEHPTLSKSQEVEVNKYQRVYFLRDVEDRTERPNQLWERF